MSDDWSLQVSLKTPAGALINVRGATGADVSEGLEYICGITELITNTEQLLGAASTVQAVMSTPVVAPTPIHTQPSGNPVAPAAGTNTTDGVEQIDRWGNKLIFGHSSAPACPHGGMVAKYGVSKAGKPYSGWFCPTDKGVGGSNPNPNACAADFATKRP